MISSWISFILKTVFLVAIVPLGVLCSLLGSVVWTICANRQRCRRAAYPTALYVISLVTHIAPVLASATLISGFSRSIRALVISVYKHLHARNNRMPMSCASITVLCLRCTPLYVPAPFGVPCACRPVASLHTPLVAGHSVLARCMIAAVGAPVGCVGTGHISWVSIPMIPSLSCAPAFRAPLGATLSRGQHFLACRCRSQSPNLGEFSGKGTLGECAGRQRNDFRHFFRLQSSKWCELRCELRCSTAQAGGS